MGENVFSPHLVIQEVKPPRRLLLGLHVERSLELPNLRWSCQAHANLLFSAPSNTPRTRVPFLPRYYPGSPVIWTPPTPVRPASLGSVATVATQTGLPCCKSPRVRTCCAHYPGEQGDRHLSVHQVVLSGLRPSVGDSALALGVSRPVRASLTLRPVRSLTRPATGLCPRGFDGMVTLPISRVATKVNRHLLGPDFHRLRRFTFHGTPQSAPTAAWKSRPEREIPTPPTAIILF